MTSSRFIISIFSSIFLLAFYSYGFGSGYDSESPERFFDIHDSSEEEEPFPIQSPWFTESIEERWRDAISSEDAEELFFILNRGDLPLFFSTNILNDKNVSALHVAIQKRHHQLIKALINRRTITHDYWLGELATSADKISPLTHATLVGDVESVKILLTAGVNIEPPGHNFNALHVAAEDKTRHEILKLLLEHGASSNSPAQNGATPIVFAALEQNLEGVSELLARGARLNLRDQFGRSLLHLVAPKKGCCRIAEFLIARGMEIDDRCNKGSTPLHYATNFNNVECIELLFRAGASLSATNNNGKRPIDLARNDEIRKLFAKEERIREDANRLAPKLLQLISKHYGASQQTSLITNFINSHGLWGDTFAPSQLDKERWLKPFNLFLKAHAAEEEAARRVVEKFLAFFNFTLPDARYSPLNFAEKVLSERKRTTLNMRTPLSDYAVSESSQTFFSLKLSELQELARHPDRYIVKPSPFSRDQQCPVYILTQDANHVRAQIMSAHFGGLGFVEGFGSDALHDGAKLLFTEILKYNDIPSDRIDNDDSVTLTLAELKVVEDYLKSRPNTRFPELLALRRERPVLVRQERTPLRDVISADAAASSSKTKTTRAKRTERNQDVELAEVEPQTLHSFADLAKTSRKRKSKNNKRARGRAYDYTPAFRNEFRPLSDLPTLAAASSKTSLRTNAKQVFPDISSSTRFVSDDDHTTTVSLYDAINQISIKSIKTKVNREVERESVVYDEIKPYSYPILGNVAMLPPSSTTFSWTRSLKPYQQEALQELLRYDEHGLSKLLALEMGLGKTFVFGEFLLHRIAKTTSPLLHLLSAPVSVVGQIEKELTKLFLEASITAWQITGKNVQGSERWHLTRELLASANDNDDALTSVLRVLPYFKDFHVYGIPASTKFLRDISSAQLVRLIRQHFADVEQLLSNHERGREQFREMLEALYRELKLPPKNEDVFAYLLSEESMMKACTIAGRILDLFPGRAQINEMHRAIPEDELSQIRRLGLSREFIAKEHFTNLWDAKKAKAEMSSILAPSAKPKVLLLGLKDLHTFRDQFPRHGVGSLIIDEANRVQNYKKISPKKKTGSQKLKESIASLRAHSFANAHTNNVVLVTGTPFENDLMELWNLLEHTNSAEYLPASTINSLINDTLNQTLRQIANLIDKSGQPDHALIAKLVTKSFGHFIALRSMVQSMVHRRATHDEDVISDWDGRVPTRVDRKILIELAPTLKDKLNTSLTNMRGLAQRSLHTQLLIHTSLEERSLKEQESANWPFLDAYRTGDDNEKQAWIQQSPYLSAVLNDKNFHDALEGNQKRIIFVDRLALAAAFKLVLEDRYGHRNIETFLYDGDLKAAHRENTIRNFRTALPDHPTVLIAMIKAGGVGLNLAEAHGRHICATQWNEGQKRQADARLIRANNVGEKDMPEIEFTGTYYTIHPKAIRKKKRNWERFLWQHTNDRRELLLSWTSVLKAELFHQLLNIKGNSNTMRNPAQARDEYRNIVAKLDGIIAGISDDKLASAVALARHQASEPLSMPPAPLSSSNDSYLGDDATDLSSQPLDDIFANGSDAWPRRPVAMANLDQNCWCNALVQMIASTPSLRSIWQTVAQNILHLSSESSSSSTLSTAHQQVLISAFDRYEHARAQHAMLPAEYSQSIREALSHFSGGRISNLASAPEDPQEALQIIFNWHDELVRKGIATEHAFINNMRFTKTFSPAGTPYPVDPVRYFQEDYGTLDANLEAIVTLPTSMISLSLEEASGQTLPGLLQNFFASDAEGSELAEYLDGRFNARKFQLIKERNQFIHRPQELMVTLNRFGTRRVAAGLHEPFKINESVTVPLHFNLPAHAIMSDDAFADSAYELRSFMVHVGKNFGGGHYILYLKENDQWWRCSDTEISHVIEDEIEDILNGDETTYIHHYRLQSQR